MEAFIKKAIKFTSYATALALVSSLGVLGFNKQNGDYTIERASADTPYSQSSYYSQGNYYSQGSYWESDGCDGDGADGDDCAE